MSLIRKLSKDQDVIINTADKGSCIVLLDRDKYVQAGRNHLDDTQTYTRLSGDITDTIKKTITIKLNKLHEKGLLSKSHYTFCLPPEDYRTSLMYFLIKLHKNPHSYRPICSWCQQCNLQHLKVPRPLAQTSRKAPPIIHFRLHPLH